MTLTTGLPAGIKAIAAAGGVSLNFGGSLGGLASLQTSGSVIPLAKLVAEGTFGINLTSSTSVSVGPSAFQNGPQASVTTTQQGGKAITVTKVRQGSSAQSVDAVFLVTVKGGGTFTLSSGGNTTGPITAGSDISSSDLSPLTWAASATVHKSKQPEGWVYTIDIASSAAPVTELTGSGTGLTAQDEIDEVQVQNATGGTFTFSFNGGSVSEPYNSTGSDLGAQTFITAVPNSTTAGSVTLGGSAGDYTIEFTGGWAGTDVADASTDSTNLTGALDTASHPGNGTLPSDATFDTEITDSPAISTKIVQDGVASVTTTTTHDGGTGLGANTATQGGASVHEVQTLNVRAATTGTFTLTFGTGMTAQTTGGINASLGATALAAAVQSALNASPVNANVTVTGADTLGGKLLTITFTSTGDQPQLLPTTTVAFGGVNETQTVTIAGAVSGTFTLLSNGVASPGISFDGSNLQSAITTLMGHPVTVTPNGGGSFTVTFDGTGLTGTNVKPLAVGDISGLTAQNEIQFVQLLNTTGGTFTLTTTGTPGTSTTPTTSTTTAISYNAQIGHATQPQNPTATKASGGTLAPGTYYYVITAITASGEGVASASVHATTDASNGTITLTWDAVTGATSYRIYRGTSAGSATAFFAPGGTSATFNDDGSATPTGNSIPPTDLAQQLSNMPALGAAANEVHITGDPTSGWTITFDGTDTHGKHFDKLVGDPGGLLNSNTLTPIHVVVDHTTTGTDLNGDGKTDQNDIVVAVQKALDAAAVSTGITPGFLSAAISHGTLFTAGATWFAHAATDDESLEVVVPLTPATISTHVGSLTVTGTTGNFTITVAGQTTNTIAIGSGAQVVQSALQTLLGTTDTVTVTLSGSTYTLTFVSTPFSAVSGMVVLAGAVPQATKDSMGNTVHNFATIGSFEAALQSQILSLLQGAGIGAGTITVGDNGASKLTISSSSLDFGLAFQEPVVATVGGGRVSLTAPQVLRTSDPSQPSIQISRSVNVDVANYNDASLQVLGLATSPTRLTYTSGVPTEIDFTLFVNNAVIPIALTNFTGVNDIAGLVNAAADDDQRGAHRLVPQRRADRAGADPGLPPEHQPGRRRLRRRRQSHHVPRRLRRDDARDRRAGEARQRDDDNGAVTELGFQAVTGATSHGQAGLFFLNNVHLTGTVELVLQDVSATASLGFLGLTGTATGTLPEQRLLSLTADIRLRNPLVPDNDPDQYLLNISTLINAIRAGHFLYSSDDSTKAAARPQPRRPASSRERSPAASAATCTSSRPAHSRASAT